MAQIGMSERKVTLPEGLALFVSERTGDGPPVLFINSLAADLSMWSHVRERLPGRATISFDVRGHGRSDVVEGDCTVADLGRDALALMDALGIEQAVLCGLSLGGITAMWMAGRAPERVAGLVLANTAASFPPPAMWKERAEAARAGRFPALVEPTLERWLTEPFRRAHQETTDAVRSMIAATPPHGYAAACAALADADLSDALGRYGGPVLVLAGRHDQSTPVARAQEMQALAPQARLIVLEAAHLSCVETGSAFADWLNGFVSEIETGGGGDG